MKTFEVKLTFKNTETLEIASSDKREAIRKAREICWQSKGLHKAEAKEIKQ